MIIKRSQIPSTTQQRYKLGDEGSFMVRITGTIYGLPQAGFLAQEQLFAHLAAHGFHQAPNTPCLFRHDTRNIMFTLVVDDFGVKYSNLVDFEFLADILRKRYTMTTTSQATQYLGMTISRNRLLRTITLSMPAYVSRALKRFNVSPPSRPVHNPMVYLPPVYGSTTPQLAPPPDHSPSLDKAGILRLQEIIGVFLFYARAIDGTMLTAVTKLSSSQAHATEAVRDSCNHFLDYAATYPNAELVFHASDMILMVQSDCSFLSERNSRSRIGGIHYLTSSANPDDSFVNGAILCTSSILPCVVTSAFEGEYGGLYVNGQHAEALRNTLMDMGYPQGPTTLISDNSAAVGIATFTAKQRRSKHIDLRFHWIRDRANQGHFNILWRAGITNLADYFTKILPTSIYRSLRSFFVSS